MTTDSELISKVSVTPATRIIDAVAVLNNGHRRIVLVIDENGQLTGVVADSNIRRAVLARVDFERPIADIMVTSPLTVAQGTPPVAIRALMEKTGIYEIPEVDSARRVVAVHFIDEILAADSGASDERVAVVMAGGLGSRLYPLTEDVPKPLIPVGGQPILFTLLDHLIAAGFNRIWLALNFKGEMIRAAVGAVPAYHGIVDYVEEEQRMGTAGALTLLHRVPRNPFVVLNGDLLTKVAFDQMLRFHEFERNLVTVALKEEVFKLPYGVAKVEGTRILEMQEKPDQRVFINAGVYVIDPIVIERIPHGQFYDMTDVINSLLESSLRVGSFPVHEYWLDIGRPEQLQQAQVDFQRHFQPKAT